MPAPPPVRVALAPALLALAALPACAAYSPPVHLVDHGAPGRLRQGDLEVGGGMTAVSAYPFAGGGYVGYGVRDWAAVEGGVEGSGGWVMVRGGGRLTHAPRREHKFHPAFDGEFGVGFGAGGECSRYNTRDGVVCDGRPWHQRPAFGAYAGGGAGYHLSFFALYARVRAQAAVADHLPGTFHGSAHGGVQFRIARLVDLYASVGYTGQLTGAGSRVGFLTWALGVSVHFGLRPGDRRPPPPR